MDEMWNGEAKHRFQAARRRRMAADNLAHARQAFPPKIGRGFAQEGLRARNDGFFGKNAQ